ncbi:hypothetical protein KJ059_09475 [Myxococcota bacterium]|nr:hypothetical protein [Myxococcota bacterium]
MKPEDLQDLIERGRAALEELERQLEPEEVSALLDIVTAGLVADPVWGPRLRAALAERRRLH